MNPRTPRRRRLRGASASSGQALPPQARSFSRCTCGGASREFLIAINSMAVGCVAEGGAAGVGLGGSFGLGPPNCLLRHPGGRGR